MIKYIPLKFLKLLTKCVTIIWDNHDAFGKLQSLGHLIIVFLGVLKPKTFLRD